MKGYVDFEGRSTRSDYWFAYLANMLTVIAFLCVARNLWRHCKCDRIKLFGCYFIYHPIYLFAFGIAAILPGIAVTVRRLRDAGYNWPYILFL